MCCCSACINEYICVHSPCYDSGWSCVRCSGCSQCPVGCCVVIDDAPAPQP